MFCLAMHSNLCNFAILQFFTAGRLAHDIKLVHILNAVRSVTALQISCPQSFNLASWSIYHIRIKIRIHKIVRSLLVNYHHTKCFYLNLQSFCSGVPAVRNEVIYDCCPEPYVDITFLVKIRRRTVKYFKSAKFMKIKSSVANFCYIL